MPFIVLRGMSIVKGIMAGDEFLFDHEFTDPDTGVTQIGIWKSAVQNADSASVVRDTTETRSYDADAGV